MNIFLAYFFSYGIHFNSLQDAKRFDYAFLQIKREVKYFSWKKTLLEFNLLQVFLRWGKIMKKYIAYYNRKMIKLEKKLYIKNTYYWCDFFSFVSPSCDFPGHLRFWLQKYLVQNWRELFTRRKLTVIIFRNFVKLSRWERKMKVWENCNAIEKMTKNKCVSYWTRDISSWSLEEKLHWYNITRGVNSSLSIQFWKRVICPALRRKGILRIASVLHVKKKSWI